MANEQTLKCKCGWVRHFLAKNVNCPNLPRCWGKLGQYWNLYEKYNFLKKNFLAEVFEKLSLINIKISFIIHKHTLKVEFIDLPPRQAFQHIVLTCPILIVPTYPDGSFFIKNQIIFMQLMLVWFWHWLP